ncbi:MAG TPA: hypothetical protein VGB77_02635, partial [Abditibacteriaceae bacterium]
DKGRVGVPFLHAIETDQTTDILQIVNLIIQALSQQSFTKICESIEAIAQGRAQPLDIFNLLRIHFDHGRCRNLNFSQYKPMPNKSIAHDCGGASAAAWLAMATSHLTIVGPWEIFDHYSPTDEFISTVSSYSKATQTLFLSEYLQAAISNYEIQTMQAQRLPPESNQQTKISVLEPEPMHSKTLVNAEKALSTKSIPKTVLSDNLSVDETPQNDSKRIIKKLPDFPDSGQIVTLATSAPGNLRVNGEHNSYKITAQNCVSFEAHPGHYEVVVKQPTISLRFSKNVSLILPKENSMLEWQRRALDDFESIYVQLHDNPQPSIQDENKSRSANKWIVLRRAALIFIIFLLLFVSYHSLYFLSKIIELLRYRIGI